MAILSPTVNQIIAIVDFFNHHRNIGRFILQITIKRDDAIALSVVKAGTHGGRLTKIPAKLDDLHTLVAAGKGGRLLFWPGLRSAPPSSSPPTETPGTSRSSTR